MNQSLQLAIEQRERADPERLQLLRRLAVTEEEEQRRIARGMHDHFCQMLTALRLQVGMLKETCRETRLSNEIEALEAAAKHLDHNLHHFMRELRPAVPDAIDLCEGLMPLHGSLVGKGRHQGPPARR